MRSVAAVLTLLMLVGCAKARPAVLTAPVDPVQQLRQDITTATTAAGVQRGTWGVIVDSLDRGERLFELNPRTLLVPASVAKLISLATAVDAVGWNYRFETHAQATGPMIDGVLRGDLVIVGAGDPTIGGRAGDDLGVWVEAFHALGIRRIDGRVIGDDDGFEEPRPGFAWAWDDLGYSFGSLFGALNLAENRMTVTIAAGAGEGAPASLTVDPDLALRPLINRAITGARGSQQLLWPEQRPGEPDLTIAGSIPLGAPPAMMLVSAGNPTSWFATALRDRFIKAGIEVTGAAVDIDDAVPRPNPARMYRFYTYPSHPLSEIAQPLLKDSINMYGEAILRLNTSAAPRTNDAALEGLRQRLDAWGIPREGWQLVDGSGLSRRDVVTADTVVAVLKRMYDPAGASPWMTALPIAGRDGTLDGRLKGTAAENNLRAKTGSMSNIRSLAGYVRTADGEALAFAIIVDNFEGTGAQALAAIDTIAARLASFRRGIITRFPVPH